MVFKFRGAYDLGRHQVPPLPRFTIFTDRDDGKLWALTHDSTFGFVGIDDVVPTTATYLKTFGPFEGPVLPTEPRVRLFVRGGALGYEVIAESPHVSDLEYGRVLTRRAQEGNVFEIIEGSTFSLINSVALSYQQELP